MSPETNSAHKSTGQGERCPREGLAGPGPVQVRDQPLSLTLASHKGKVLQPSSASIRSWPHAFSFPVKTEVRLLVYSAFSVLRLQLVLILQGRWPDRFRTCLRVRSQLCYDYKGKDPLVDLPQPGNYPCFVLLHPPPNCS